jgi:hypothetical protein
LKIILRMADEQLLIHGWNPLLQDSFWATFQGGWRFQQEFSERWYLFFYVSFIQFSYSTVSMRCHCLINFFPYTLTIWRHFLAGKPERTHDLVQYS